MKCKICGTLTSSFYDKRIDATFHWCKKCDYIYKDSADLITEVQEKAIYDSHQNSLEDEKYVAYLDKFIQKGVLPYVKEASFGLDYGSGPTPVLKHILTNVYYYNVVGYDLFYENNEKNLEQVYDFVVTTEVIEHIKEPVQLFNKFNGLLKTGGVLSLMTLLHPRNLEELQDWHYTRDRSHISLFSMVTLETIAKMTGFKVIFTDHHRIITMLKD